MTGVPGNPGTRIIKIYRKEINMKDLGQELGISKDDDAGMTIDDIIDAQDEFPVDYETN